MSVVNRRTFVTSTTGAIAVSAVVPSRGHARGLVGRVDPTVFPQQDPEIVQGVVGASHGNFDRVKELVEGYPELAKASWDWGFGDWESALGAASHTGRREIALLLIERGARPNLFSAAMLGQIDVVRAMIEARPGIQRTPGPHGIPLLSHAAAGKEEAADVHAYLLELGDAGLTQEGIPLADEAKSALLGRYRYGASADEVFVVTQRDSGALFIARDEGTARGLTHVGDRVFTPVGAPSVRIAFSGPAIATTIVMDAGSDTIRAEREG
jgi:hypothetical protein